MLGLLIFAAVVIIVAVIIIWAVEQLLPLLGGPSPTIAKVIRVLVIVIALVVILQRAWPLLPSG